MKRDELREAALAADARYSRELERVYGPNHGDDRYRRVHADAACAEALQAKIAADRAFWGEP